MGNLLGEFKAFVTRGNVLDLAVAVILGIAFGAVVTALVDGVLMPLIAALFGRPSFDAISFSVGDGEILIGTFLTALVNFLIIAFALFLIIRAVAAMQRNRVEETPAPSDEAVLLAEIRDLLRAGGRP